MSVPPLIPYLSSYLCGIPKCDSVIKDQRNYKRHLHQAHNELLPVACPRCPKKFLAEKGLAQHHRVIHRMDLQHICGYCTASFKGSEQVREHVSAHHIQVGVITSYDTAVVESQALRIYFYVNAQLLEIMTVVGLLALPSLTIEQSDLGHLETAGTANEVVAVLEQSIGSNEPYGCTSCSEAFGSYGVTE
ncbi:MAG: hypothetical protein S4CHLAM81_01560 [Chlamydiales bacterium]|nr:hypothetical protein [Chlamydiales bacterium]MCH9634952.1 hypothetical protein [Chlamydiales bacterium]MCH9703374.1 hypothetical protein [Chlamydiota bacterium]